METISWIERKPLNMSKLSIALLADIHHGPDYGTKKGTKALSLLERFNSFVDGLTPDVTVELGDRITDVDETTDRKNAKEISAALRRIKGDVYHLLGNHDIDNLSFDENQQLLQRPLHSRSLDKNGFHLVFWNAQLKTDRKKGFSLSQDDLDWLRADLAVTKLPTVIFSHVPLDNGSMKGNYYFEKRYPHLACYTEDQGEIIRDVVERSEKVILCINGHTHWNAHHCIDGIHYVTIPSLTEIFTTWPEPNEAYARLCLDAAIDIEIHGRTPMTYCLPIKKLKGHWVNVEKDYAPKATLPRR